MVKKGFTLVELVIVIVLLGILSAVALPRFLNLSKDAEDAILKNFLGDLKTARESYKMIQRFHGYPVYLNSDFTEPGINSYVRCGSNVGTERLITPNQAAVADCKAEPPGSRELCFMHLNTLRLDDYQHLGLIPANDGTPDLLTAPERCIIMDSYIPFAQRLTQPAIRFKTNSGRIVRVYQDLTLTVDNVELN